jgi:hypothetical protein
VLVLADVAGGDDSVAIDADAEEARFFEFGVGEGRAESGEACGWGGGGVSGKEF